MEKRGQVTIFIIIGLVLLSFAAFAYIFYNFADENQDSLPNDPLSYEEMNPIKEEMSICLENRLKKGITFYGLSKPDLDKYLNENMNECIQFSSFEEKGYAFDRKNSPIVDTTTSKTVVTLDVQPRMTATFKDRRSRIPDFTIKVFLDSEEDILIDSNGIVQNTVYINSSDDNAQLVIPKGTKVTGSLNEISVSVNNNNQISYHHFLFASVYDFSPDGTTFTPPVPLTIFYEPSLISSEQSMENLRISYYDTSTNSWNSLDTEVDEVNHVLKSYISHFSEFTVSNASSTNNGEETRVSLLCQTDRMLFSVIKYNGKIYAGSYSSAMSSVNKRDARLYDCTSGGTTAKQFTSESVYSLSENNGALYMSLEGGDSSHAQIYKYSGSEFQKIYSHSTWSLMLGTETFNGAVYAGLANFESPGGTAILKCSGESCSPLTSGEISNVRGGYTAFGVHNNELYVAKLGYDNHKTTLSKIDSNDNVVKLLETTGEYGAPTSFNDSLYYVLSKTTSPFTGGNIVKVYKYPNTEVGTFEGYSLGLWMDKVGDYLYIGVGQSWESQTGKSAVYRTKEPDGGSWEKVTELSMPVLFGGYVDGETIYVAGGKQGSYGKVYRIGKGGSGEDPTDPPSKDFRVFTHNPTKHYMSIYPDGEDIYLGSYADNIGSEETYFSHITTFNTNHEQTSDCVPFNAESVFRIKEFNDDLYITLEHGNNNGADSGEVDRGAIWKKENGAWGHKYSISKEEGAEYEGVLCLDLVTDDKGVYASCVRQFVVSEDGETFTSITLPNGNTAFRMDALNGRVYITGSSNSEDWGGTGTGVFYIYGNSSNITTTCNITNSSNNWTYTNATCGNSTNTTFVENLTNFTSVKGNYSGMYAFPDNFFENTTIKPEEVTRIIDLIYLLEMNFSGGKKIYNSFVNGTYDANSNYDVTTNVKGLSFGNSSFPKNNFKNHSWYAISAEMSRPFWKNSTFFVNLSSPGNLLGEATSSLTAQYVYETIEDKSNHFGLLGGEMDSLTYVFSKKRAYQKSAYENYTLLGKPYTQNSTNSNSTLTAQALSYKLILIGDTYGWHKFSRFYRGFSYDLMNNFTFWNDGVSEKEEITYMIATLNVAFNQNFLEEFEQLNFPVDNTLYDQTYPKIKNFVNGENYSDFLKDISLQKGIRIDDDDGDGYAMNVDCNDTKYLIHPNAKEYCDGLDNDCDNVIDENCTDTDGDGYKSDVDCNDNNSSIHPCAKEITNGVDDDCDGIIDEACTDSDNDGYCDDVDCNSTNSLIYPNATELCDCLDNDCDNTIDEGCSNNSGNSTRYIRAKTVSGVDMPAGWSFHGITAFKEKIYFATVSNNDYAYIYSYDPKTDKFEQVKKVEGRGVTHWMGNDGVYAYAAVGKASESAYLLRSLDGTDWEQVAEFDGGLAIDGAVDENGYMYIVGGEWQGEGTVWWNGPTTGGDGGCSVETGDDDDDDDEDSGNCNSNYKITFKDGKKAYTNSSEVTVNMKYIGGNDGTSVANFNGESVGYGSSTRTLASGSNSVDMFHNNGNCDSCNINECGGIYASITTLEGKSKVVTNEANSDGASSWNTYSIAQTSNGYVSVIPVGCGNCCQNSFKSTFTFSEVTAEEKEECGSSSETCGDGVCGEFETCNLCSEDCKPCVGLYCGDGSCNNEETCASCSKDCTEDCDCGDGHCDEETETCTSCSRDCGATSCAKVICPYQYDITYIHTYYPEIPCCKLNEGQSYRDNCEFMGGS